MMLGGQGHEGPLGQIHKMLEQKASIENTLDNDGSPMTVHRIFLFVILIAFGCLFGGWGGGDPVVAQEAVAKKKSPDEQASDEQASDKQASDTARQDIKQLIEQLGDDRYIIRAQAKERLQQLGLEAFDALRRAKEHHDSEIAVASHYLVSSLLVSWSKETDPAPVREALSEYGAQEPSERESRISRLAKLSDRQGLEALVRLVRFETNLSLSRVAALQLMQQAIPEDKDVRRQHAETILRTLQKSDRNAADWLRVYAKDLSQGVYSASDWDVLVKKQRRDLDAAADESTSRASVLELIRICSVRAALSGSRAEGIQLAVDNMDLIQPTTRDLVEACGWAVDNDLHEFVLALQSKNQRLFKTHALLLYSAAQAEKLSGRGAEADALALKALAINAFPADQAALDALSSNEREEIAQTHLLVAEELSQRGLFDWARTEYEHIVDNVELTSFAGMRTRGRLSDMLGELQLHDEVIATLQPLMDRINKDDVFRTRARMNMINLSYYQSQLEFHRGLKAKKDGDVDLAKSALRAAYKEYRGNIDILIAMYRINADDDWNLSVRRDLVTHISSIESEVQAMEARYRELGGRADDVRQLSQSLNEYAWLVSNTEGDYEAALKASQRSLELTPDDGAKTDTLARCYLALKKYGKAREAQLRAVKLMPNSPPMLRQLDEINQLIEAEEDDEDK